MTKAKAPRKPKRKSENTPASAPKKRRTTLPGQQKFQSLRDAYSHVEQTLGMLHVQTHDSLKRKGRG